MREDGAAVEEGHGEADVHAVEQAPVRGAVEAHADPEERAGDEELPRGVAEPLEHELACRRLARELKVGLRDEFEPALSRGALTRVRAR